MTTTREWLLKGLKEGQERFGLSTRQFALKLKMNPHNLYDFFNDDRSNMLKGNNLLNAMHFIKTGKFPDDSLFLKQILPKTLINS